MPHNGKRGCVTGSTETHFSHRLLLATDCSNCSFHPADLGIHISHQVSILLAFLLTLPQEIWLPNKLAFSHVFPAYFSLIQLHVGP